MSLKDLLEIRGHKAYIVEIGAGCPIAHEIFKCSGASKVVYHTESPYGSAKDVYGDVIGDKRMVSLEAVHNIAIKLADSNNGKYNMVIVTSFQIKSGNDDERIPHGWVCIGIQQEDKTWRFTVAHLTLMNELGYSLNRANAIDKIYAEVYRIVLGEGNYQYVDEYYDRIPNNFHVLTSDATVFFKDAMQIRLEDYSRKYKRIAVYKGSFNPIHFGHVAIAKKIRDENPDTLVIFAISKDTYGKGTVDYDNLVARLKAICAEDFIVAILKNGYFFDCFQYLKNRTKLPVELIMGVDTYNRLISCYETCDFSPNEEFEINEIVDDSNMLRHYDSFRDVVTRNKARIFNKTFEDATFRVFGRQQPLNTDIKPNNLEYYSDFDCQVSSSEIRQLQASGESDRANKLQKGDA